MTQAKRIGIYGASGSGKTTKALQLIKSLSRVVVFDPVDEWGDHGYTRTNLANIRQDLAKRWRTGFRLAVVPAYGAEPKLLHRLSETVRDAQVETNAAAPICFVVDELNTGFPVTSLPADMLGFGELCSRGRHWAVNVVGITQRIAEVNTRWRGNTSCSFIFRQASTPDVKAAEALLPPGHRGKVSQLQNFHYLYVEQGSVSTGQVKRKT